MLAINNIVCLRHPQYNGSDSPDLTCKICCSKFVARIRAEQKDQFEATWNQAGPSAAKDAKNFEPLKPAHAADVTSSPKRHANFDGSWI
jgi:hypothetical protein